jgi:cytoskeletal protein CcmA (bactofilin family)
MNKLSPPRPAATGPDLAVRPGAGVLGLSRPDPLYKSAPRETPEAEPSSEGRLIVGEGIHVKGQIDSCDTLIVEGRVEAALEARELKVCRGGIYSGRASVRAASIDGSFDGELTVEGLLIIRSGGRISGKLRYREMEIEQGGRISGDIDLLEGETAPRWNLPKASDETPDEESDGRLMENAIAR